MPFLKVNHGCMMITANKSWKLQHATIDVDIHGRFAKMRMLNWLHSPSKVANSTFSACTCAKTNLATIRTVAILRHCELQIKRPVPCGAIVFVSVFFWIQVSFWFCVDQEVASKMLRQLGQSAVLFHIFFSLSRLLVCCTMRNWASAQLLNESSEESVSVFRPPLLQDDWSETKPLSV